MPIFWMRFKSAPKEASTWSTTGSKLCLRALAAVKGKLSMIRTNSVKYKVSVAWNAPLGADHCCWWGGCGEHGCVGRLGYEFWPFGDDLVNPWIGFT
jgi:hypothetical protein